MLASLRLNVRHMSLTRIVVGMLEHENDLYLAPGEGGGGALLMRAGPVTEMNRRLRLPPGRSARDNA